VDKRKFGRFLTEIAQHLPLQKGNPAYNQSFTKNKANFPIDYYSHISEPTVPSVEIPRIIEPYELEGSVLTPLYGDQADAGRRLKSILIGDHQFDLPNPVELKGGPRFGLYQRYNEDPNAIWAANKGPASYFSRGWRELSEKYGGADVLPVFTGQGRQALLSNTMFSDILAQMLRNSPIGREDAKLLTEGAKKIIPDFKGIKSENLANQLIDLPFEKRRDFANFLASKPLQKKGFPDIVAIANAINDPGAHADARMAGYVINKADLKNTLNRKPLHPHPTYENNLHGEVLGGFREQIPARLMFRPAYEARMPEAEAAYLMYSGPNIGRFMDPQAVDEISQYIEDAAAARKLGGYAEGGLYTDEERARRAEEQMGGVTSDGYASSLPPTLSMQFGDLVSPYLDAAYDLFPKENPRGKFLRDMIMGEAPEAARRMAEGEPYVLANTRSRNPLDWKINSEALDMAGALPLATATGALGKAAAAMKASAPLLGGLGVIKQKGGNWVTSNINNLKDLENSSIEKYIAAKDVNKMTPSSVVARELIPASDEVRIALRAQMDALDDQALITNAEWSQLADKFSNYPRTISQLWPSPGDYLNTVKDFKQKFGSVDSPYILDGGTGVWGDTFDKFLKTHAPALEQDQALNDWAKKQLARYLQNDLATPGDPVRALAEKRTEEFARRRDASYKEADKYVEHADKLRAEGPRPGMPRGTWETAIQNAETRAQQIIEEAMLDYEKNIKEGTLHFNINSRDLPGGDDFIFLEEGAKLGRKAAGMPEETTGTSPVAKLWDVAADRSFSPQTIGGIRKRADQEEWRALSGQPDGLMQSFGLDPESFYQLRVNPMVSSPEEGAAMNKYIISENPWTNNLSPETPMYGLDHARHLHLNELMSKLSDLLPHKWEKGSMKNFGLPDSFMLKPENLKNMSVDAAIAKVADANLAYEKARLERAANNPVIQKIKDYPENDMSWVQLGIPKQTEFPAFKPGLPELDELQAISDSAIAHREKYKPELEDALKQEGSKMSHCVGGYCEPVSRGQTEIFSLRDKSGIPHTTIEVRPPSTDDWSSFWGSIPQESSDKIFGPDSPLQNTRLYSDQDIYNEASKLLVLPPPPRSSVLQIKGKSNGAPAEKYRPMVQDFLRSQGPWKDIRDGRNAGLERHELDELIDHDFDQLENINWEADENFADGGLVDADHDRLHSIISDFLSDNPGQYAELGEPQEPRRMMRQARRQRSPEFRLDLGGGSTDSNEGFGGGGHAGMRLPIGQAMLSIDAVGGGGFGQQVNPEGYLGYGPRGPVMRVGKPKFGGGANLAGIQAAIEGLPGLAGRYGISYDTQPFMLTQTLGLDERGMPRASRGDLIGGQGMGNSQRIWDRMLPDEKLMFTYNREF
jgi:hypothetical protein